jgi:hypothetical protein
LIVRHFPFPGLPSLLVTAMHLASHFDRALRRWPILAGLVAILGQPSLTWARTTTQAEQPGWLVDHYTVQDGLPTLVLTGIAEGPDGALWVSSFDGLARLDGASSSISNRTTQPDLPGNRFVDLKKGADGTLWAIEELGAVVSWRDGPFHVWQPSATTLGAAHFLRESGDRLWVATARGIGLVQGESLVPWRTDAFAEDIVELESDGAGGLWTATARHAIWHVPARGPPVRLPWPSNQPFQVYALLPLDPARVLVGSDRRGMYFGEVGRELQPLVSPREVGPRARPFRELWLDWNGDVVGRTDHDWWRLHGTTLTPEPGLT